MRYTAKDALIQAVNRERERRRKALTVTIEGIVYDADDESVRNLTGLLTAHTSGVPIQWPLPWRCADNIVRNMTYQQAVAVAGTAMNALQQLYTKSWVLKDIIIPALDQEQVVTFNITDDQWWR